MHKTTRCELFQRAIYSTPDGVHAVVAPIFCPLGQTVPATTSCHKKLLTHRTLCRELFSLLFIFVFVIRKTDLAQTGFQRFTGIFILMTGDTVGFIIMI